MEIGEKIKIRREQLGLTLQQVGDYIGVSKATIGRYETNEIKSMKHEHIEKLAIILKVSPGYLMGWTDEQGIPTERYAERKTFVTELLETMVRQGMITDPNNISEDMKKMILDSVKLEVQKILKAGS